MTGRIVRVAYFRAAIALHNAVHVGDTYESAGDSIIHPPTDVTHGLIQIESINSGAEHVDTWFSK